MGIPERIESIMKDRGISRYKLSKETGVPYTTITQILNGRTKNPQIAALQRIADYFDVSVDAFIGEETSPYYALTEKDERDIAKELDKLMNDLASDDALAFMGEPMDEEDRELLRISLENSLRLSREIAKKKFTPKKYRK